MGSQTNDPYFNPKRTRDILFGVLLVHIGIIAIPLIYSSLTDFFEPPLVVMKVGLADLPLGDSPDAGQPQPVQADTPAKTDPAPAEDFPDPTNIKPLPPEQKIEPPPVQTKVEQKTEPKVDTPPKPKTDTKPKVDPPPKTKTDPPKPKTDTKPTILSPKDIKVTTNTKSQAQIDAERKAREKAENDRREAEKARQEILNGLRQAAGSQPGRFGTTDPGEEGILATKELRDYYNQLIAFIQPKWDALSPSSTELNGKISNWPVVRLTIAKDGRITKAEFVSQSGNKKIDDPVNVLLASLKTVPVPPQAIKINITLDIR